MATKSHPIGIRVGINKNWASRWFADKKSGFSTKLIQDLKIRRFLTKKLPDAGITEVIITRDAEKINITIHSAKPGIIIGRGGSQIEEIRKYLEKTWNVRCKVDIEEISNPEMHAPVLAEMITGALMRRMNFRRVAKDIVKRAMSAGALGVKVKIGGRLNGADIARSELFSDGSIPLQTFRADIDYAWREADTTYGKIGVKVWLYRGESFETESKYKKSHQNQQRRPRNKN